jgi:hypothetical protein
VIRKRRDGLQVQVYAGRDPLTGHERYVSQQVAGQTRPPCARPSRSRPGCGRRSAPAGTEARGRAPWPSCWSGGWSGGPRCGRSRPPPWPATGPPWTATSSQRSASCPSARSKPPPWTPSTPTCGPAVARTAGHNPAKLATAPSVLTADVQPPQAQDAARLLSAGNAESPALGLFLRLAVVLGAGRGEICSLRWPDIDLDRGEVLIAGNVVRVPSKPSSTRTPRPMPSVGWRSAPARSSCCGPAGSPKPRMPWPAGRRGGRRPCVLPRPGRLEADRHGHPARGRGSGLAHRLGPGWPRRRPYDHGHLRPPPTGPGPAGGRGHGRVVSDR